MGGPFGATRYAWAEPVRIPLASGGRAGAIAMLRGADGANSGSVFLAGSKPRMTIAIEWRRGQSCHWFFDLDAKLALNTSQCDGLSAALAVLFTRFPAQFALLAPSGELQARHWLTEAFEDGGESHTKVGLDLPGHLPGVYWWTLFGREAAAFFGKDLLLAAPVAQAFDLGERGGVALRVSDCPHHAEAGQTSTAESAVRELLGAEYFFDIRDPNRHCSVIPGLTDRYFPVRDQ
jgi:hypothetical protein